ncbi:uncharacterized protein N7473_008285 [Penicillium subrubescens]|uniref:Uncharacterized protein n=1 Tax=Penicillium subrubescens TaxID=1316194 RepID=A0A1Q5TH82_9EURO|nr:uncharacterized protein N7473_008285 [Penicillium subrubescens]KAJ5892057.1 hypothetical protein N7473_008285 [Penicillium subrubescens]OKO99572.1 hypothetical protein PENSUB_8417 [Penicillium subrubescens]
MSLDPVTSGLGRGLPANKVTETATDTVQSTAQKPLQQVQETTKPLTDPVIPGEFPSEDGPRDTDQPPPEINFRGIWAGLRHWFASMIPQAFDGFEWLVTWLVNRYLPPPKQAAMYEEALKRPIASTFLVCQMICCGVPLLVFLVGVGVFAIVAVLLYIVLALLILGPILIVASMMGVSLWGWGWVLYGLVKWVDRRFLGGMITRFWLPKVQGEKERTKDDKGEGEGEGEMETEGEGDGDKKDN